MENSTEDSLARLCDRQMNELAKLRIELMQTTARADQFERAYNLLIKSQANFVVLNGGKSNESI